MSLEPARSPHVDASAPLRLLRVERLGVDRGGRRVLSDLSFSLGNGEALVVTGRNGVGKSTLLRVLAGLLPIARGAVRVVGANGEGLSALAHYLAHADGLKAALTVEENLDFWAHYLASDAQAGRNDERSEPLTIADALSRVGLAHVARAPVAILSAGQKRRVALARLLVAFRPLWLLDEPSSALDLASRERLARIMADHRARGGMIVAATHEPLGLAGARELSLEGAP